MGVVPGSLRSVEIIMPASVDRYLNRELSWLEFNERVLEEALDPQVPLLERLKFLAITASNLDEFFRVRVGGLQILAQQAVTRPDASGMTPQEQLEAIGKRVRLMTAAQYGCYMGELEPRLADEGICRLRIPDLNDAQYHLADQVFQEEVFPVLTPMAVREAAEFPLLPNLMLNVCVRLAAAAGAEDASQDRFAVIPIGPALPRFISLPAETGDAYLLLEDLLALFAGQLFVGEQILECVPFRITRNADVSVREDSAADLLAEMEQVLDERRQADCVRLEIDGAASPRTLSFLQTVLQVPDAEVYSLPGPLDLSAWFSLSDRPGAENIRYETWPPQPSPQVPSDQSMFDVIAAGDVLLYHPYESFEPVVRFIEEAADDEDVLAIKQTLYRTSRDSQVAAALLRAAENRKHVTALVELKARFDEARNIGWARRLEQAGAQVIYGVKGLKTHAKLCLVVRREPQGIQRYVHFGTGNYNEATARIYSDASLFTVDPDLGADAVSFFNAITGYSQPLRYRKIAAAPIDLRDRLLELIRTETRRAAAGHPAEILAKTNALVDRQLIDALYEASQAGVRVRLNVRGICCLKPGVTGLSENIRVISIVDRFLEHARVFSFHHGGDQRVFISSADWMPRNLDRRVELLVPVEDPHCRHRLLHVLDTCFRDNVKARRLLANGQHERVKPAGAPPLRAQQLLFDEAREAIQSARRQRATVFEPHLPGPD
jgi:polyphosphate kinase